MPVKTKSDVQHDAETIVKSGKAVMVALYAGQTFERVLCNPRRAIQFCKRVRIHSGMSHPNQVILWAMLNGRKRGNFSHNMKSKAGAT